jgi:Ca2+-binding RTX toxin-like protein
MKGFEAGRSTVRDTNGGLDWLNFAAVAGNVNLNLTALTFGVNGQKWGALSGVFEKAVTGDGADTVTGNTAANEFHGMRGNDTLRGEAGGDTLYGGEDVDSLYGGTMNDWLYGDVGNDRLWGDADSDFLDGGDGNDLLRGGMGNDTYRFGVGDKLIESVNAGTDKVNSERNLTLGANIENLSLIGQEDLNGTGNGLRNLLNGNGGDNRLNGGSNHDTLNGLSGDDTLIGGSGNDMLNGGDGDDVLTGGAGEDTFRFTVAPSAGNVDEIQDFKPGTDMIHVDNAVFNGLPAGALAGSAFVANNSGMAVDAGDRIIYEKDTGYLWHDVNGSGLGGRVKFAEIDPGLNVTAADFFVF